MTEIEKNRNIKQKLLAATLYIIFVIISDHTRTSNSLAYVESVNTSECIILGRSLAFTSFEETSITKSNECRAALSKIQGKETEFAVVHVMDDGGKPQGKAMARAFLRTNIWS